MRGAAINHSAVNVFLSNEISVQQYEAMEKRVEQLELALETAVNTARQYESKYHDLLDRCSDE